MTLMCGAKYKHMAKVCMLSIVTFFVWAVLTVTPAHAASLTGASPGSGAVISGSSVTFTLSFSNNVAGNEAWATNQSAFSVYDDFGTYYPCAPSRNYFGNTPGDTPDPQNMRRLIFVTVSNLQPGMHYTLSGSGLLTQGHVSIPAFSISFSTDGEPVTPEPEPIEPEVPDSGDGDDQNGEGGSGNGNGAGSGTSDGGSGSGEQDNSSHSDAAPDQGGHSDNESSHTETEQQVTSQNSEEEAPVVDTQSEEQTSQDAHQKESSSQSKPHQTSSAGKDSQAGGGAQYYAVKDLIASVPEEDEGEETVVTTVKPLLMGVVLSILLGSLVRSTTWFANKNLFVYKNMQRLCRMIRK